MGVAGGVLSVAALTTAAAPSFAETPVEQPINEVTQTLDLSQLRAAHATAQAAVNYELLATRTQSFDDALKAAQARKRADETRIAAEESAKQRAAVTKTALQTPQTGDSTPSSAPSTPSTAPGSARNSVSPASGSVQRVLDFLRAQVGKSYVLGGTGPYSYDCSGLVQAAFKTINIDLPRTSQEQSDVGTPVSLSNLRAGDILFWGGQGSAYHAAVYIGNGQFIGAQNPSEGIVLKPLTYSEPDFAIRVT